MQFSVSVQAGRSGNEEEGPRVERNPQVRLWPC
jgi:hypothetical protein